MDYNFYVGQRVTPTAPVTKPWVIAAGLEFGEIYTIRKIVFDTRAKLTAFGKCGVVVLMFKEITRIGRRSRFGEELGFYHADFKPVTDISTLEALLHITKTPEHDPV